MEKILGIIPARGGSKSIPRKNIKALLGKPLLAYTIEAAQGSGVLDRIVVSTDDPEIAEVGRRYNAEVPFLRPPELARDHTPTLPVLQHAVGWLKSHEGYSPDYVMLLQPTAPARQAFHIREAIEKLHTSHADSVVSVLEIPGNFSPHWAVEVDEKGFGTLLVSGDPIRKRVLRRQSLPKAYAHNGAIYLFRAELLSDPQDPNFYGDRVAIYEMDHEHSVNIDEPRDWERAEAVLKKLYHGA